MGTRAVITMGATSTANNASLVGGLAASPVAARLYSITVYNGTGAKAYVQVFDSATVPGDGAVPKMSANVPADSQVSFDYGDGRIFGTGIAIALSTTAATLMQVTSVGSLIDCTFRQI